MAEEKDKSIRPPSYLDALIPIIVLVILLASAVYLYGADGTAGPIQVALMLPMMVAGLVGHQDWAPQARRGDQGSSRQSRLLRHRWSAR